MSFNYCIETTLLDASGADSEPICSDLLKYSTNAATKRGLVQSMHRCAEQRIKRDHILRDHRWHMYATGVVRRTGEIVVFNAFAERVNGTFGEIRSDFSPRPSKSTN